MAQRGAGSWTSSERSRAAEAARTSLWWWPALVAVVSFAAALLLQHVHVGDSGWRDVLWPGDSNAASTTLQVISTAAVTVTTFTFSLMVVALQLASQQFSPRLLREFARDWVVQRVLAVLVATFVFAMTSLRGFRSGQPVPRVSMAVSFLLGLATVAALLAFIGHIIRTLRVDSMMRTVHAETVRTIAAVYGPEQDGARAADFLVDRPGGALVGARASGFVRVIDAREVLRAATEADLVVRLEARPGDHVVRGAPIAQVWARGGATSPQLDPRFVDAVQRAVHVDFERTAEQDVAFGFRQLVDIAVKALSPAVNDPVTAAHSIGHMADLLGRLARSDFGPTVHTDDDGVDRLVLPDRDLRYYLELACGQIRRFGRREPTVLTTLLSMLRDAALAAVDDDQRSEIARQVDLIVAETPDDLVAEDAASVPAMAEQVRLVLRGDVAAGYRDRSGETRTM
ncbi:MAG: DUF2254 domain-containing protein [Jatrophihabitans sp.]|uniref:DUF2254 domain-containing protein n=1 Tax=Jatrophihabitans sp. TaxID=1932789 RepID=UPI003F7E4A98